MIFISIVTLDLVGRPSVSEDTCEQVVADPALCRCFGVSQKTVAEVIKRDSLRTVEAVTACTDAGGACTGCHSRIRKLLADHHGDPSLAVVRRRGQ